jgi:hypothetical protein
MIRLKAPLTRGAWGIAVELLYIAAILLAAYALCIIWQFLT